MAQAQPGRTYALLVRGRVHCFFTREELPFWNEEQTPAIDITDADPRPAIGDHYIDGKFVAGGTLPAERKVAADTQRDELRYSPVAFKGHVFQVDRESLWLLTFQVNDLNAGGVLEPDFAWWDIANVAVPMSADDLRALHHLIRNRNYNAMKAARSAKDAVEAEVIAAQEARL
jgi:hypothetical protein